MSLQPTDIAPLAEGSQLYNDIVVGHLAAGEYFSQKVMSRTPLALNSELTTLGHLTVITTTRIEPIDHIYYFDMNQQSQGQAN